MPVYLPGGSTLTWAGARAKVRTDLWRPGTGIPDDVIDRALHAAQLELEGEARWLWLENLTAGLPMNGVAASYIDCPASVQSISSLSYQFSSSLQQLTLAPLATVRDLSTTSPGYPTMYALGDGVIYFDTIVPETLTFEMVFTYQTPELLEDAITAPLVTLARHQQAVLANACAMIAMNYLKNEDEGARQRAVYERLLEHLLNRESQQRSDLYGSGIQPDDGLDIAAFGYPGVRRG